MKPHKHAEVIKAWADGAQIQQRYPDEDSWRDCNTSEELTPHFGICNLEFRIKPKVIRYRLALMTEIGGEYWISIYQSTAGRSSADPLSSFVKWLGDWQEVEI